MNNSILNVGLVKVCLKVLRHDTKNMKRKVMCSNSYLELSYKINMNKIMGKKVSIYIFPLILSVLMCGRVGISVVETRSTYAVNVMSCIIFVLVVWSMFFVYAQHKLNAFFFGKSTNLFLAVVISSVLIGCFYIYSMWGIGGLTLDPINRINAGSQYPDNLYQSAIAESYNRSLLPTALVNDETVLRYHTFSCLVVNIFSRIFNMPSFFIYSYLYPILILPLYACFQYIGVLVAKEYFTGIRTLGLSDIIVITLYNVGILGPAQLSPLGIWKSSYINSESFVLANTFALLFFIFCFLVMKTKKHINLFLYIGVPITIFVLSWTKISVGCLVAVTIGYYFFRIKSKSIKYWLLNFYYLIVLICSLWLFRGGSNSNAGNSKAGFGWFPFIKYCDNKIIGLCGHYLILSLMAIIFIVFEIKKKNYKKEDFISGKTIWIELISIITICSFLPGMLLDIGGGSAAYFSYFLEIPSMLLLCGSGHLEGVFDRLHLSFKNGIGIIFIAWIFYVGAINPKVFFVNRERVSASVNSGIFENAMIIRELVADRPEDYTIYLSEDAEVLRYYPYTTAGIYIYPGLSGVGVINASYCFDGVSYTVTDIPVTGYALAYVQHTKLSLDEAIYRAQALGKKNLIYIEGNNRYEIINLGRNY